MTTVLVFEEKAIRVICANGQHTGRVDCDNNQFIMKSQVRDDIIPGLENFSKHVGRWTNGYKGVHSAYGIRKRNVERKKLLLF